MVSGKCRHQIVHVYQSTDYSCGAAVLCSAARTLIGSTLSEEQLMPLLNTDQAVGTKRNAFLDLFGSKHLLAAKIKCTSGTNSTLEHLALLLNEGSVVFVEYLEQEENVGHWAIVVQIDQSEVILCDPWHGPKISISCSEFLERWRSGFPSEEGIMELRTWVALRTKTNVVRPS